MQIKADSVDDYLSKVPEERKEVVNKLREVMKANMPEGFKEGLGYGMPSYYVPHSVYPGGYHCDPKLPLPFASFASQKNFIALYHMGMYANKELLDWFVGEYYKHCSSKLDMGKSCVRFKKMDDIPYQLIGELMQKMSAQEWIDLYEENIKR